MNNRKIAFRRIGGRIVPINKSDNHFRAFALAGAAAAPIMVGSLLSKKYSKGFKIAEGIVGYGLFAANLADSYNHGKKEKSFWRGAGRYVSNHLSLQGGALATGVPIGMYLGYKAINKTSKGVSMARSGLRGFRDLN